MKSELAGKGAIITRLGDPGGLRGQRFHDPRITEHVLPIWFDHSAAHYPSVWQANHVPGML